MPKKVFVILGAIAAALAFHACALPETVIIKGKPKISLPTKIRAEDFNDTLVDVIKKEANNDEITILNYTGFYDNNNKNIQAFLIQLPVIQDNEVGNIGDQVGQLKNINFNLEPEDLSQDFDVGDLKKLNDPVDLIENVELDLSGMFQEMEDSINEGFVDQTGLSTPFLITGAGDLGDLPEFGDQIISLSILDTVEFGAGIFYAKIRISGPNIPGVDITFSNLKLRDNEGHTIEGVDTITGLPDVNLTDTDPERSVKFDLAGSEINKEFGLYISFKNDLSEGAPFYILPRSITVEMIPDKIEQLVFKKMTGINMKPSKLETGVHNVPIDFPMGNFVHAQIKQGTLDFELNLPSQPNSSGDSWFSNFDMTPALKILQEHSDLDADGGIWPGLNNSNSTVPALPDPWDYFEAQNNLNGKHINTKDVVVLDTSRIILSSAGTASFWLNDADMSSKKVITSIQPLLQIDSFSWVHAEIGNDIVIPSVKPVSLGGTDKYLKLIELNEVGPNISFGQVDIPGLEIMLSIPELGINNNPIKDYKEMVSNTTLNFINNTPYTLNLKNNNGDTLISSLNIEVDIRIAGNKKVIGLPDLNPSETKFKIQVLDVDFKFDWARALLSLKSVGAIENYYPSQDQDPVDLSIVHQNFTGFNFNNIDALLYINGPSILFDLNPKLNMFIHYIDKNSAKAIDDLLEDNTSLINANLFNLDPDNTGSYSGSMPPGGIQMINLNTMLEKEPTDVYFHYQIELSDEAYITPKMLENDDFDKKLNADILVLVPFQLTAGANGGDIKIPDMIFEEGKNDILDRDKSANPLPLDFIKKLTLQIAVTDDIFVGGNFYLDDGNKRFEYPFKSKSVGLSISGDNLKYINNTIPYLPKMGFHFAPGEMVQIVRNMATIKIDINTEIEYKIDLPSDKIEPNY